MVMSQMNPPKQTIRRFVCCSTSQTSMQKQQNGLNPYQIFKWNRYMATRKWNPKAMDESGVLIYAPCMFTRAYLNKIKRTREVSLPCGCHPGFRSFSAKRRAHL